MRNYKVLVFPCGTEVANEIINAIRYNKYFDLYYASSIKKTYCHLRGVDIAYLPNILEITFINRLNLLIKINQIDFLIPAHDDVALFYSQNEKDIEARIIGQSIEINTIVRNKIKTYEAMNKDIPVGKVYKDIPDIFPVFIKPKIGQGSKNIKKANSLIEYESFFINKSRNDYVVMEYFPGREYTIDCFSNKGELLYSGPRTRDKTINGITVISEDVKDSNEIKQFRNYAYIISKKLKMHGLWFFQMKQDFENNLKLLEIGTRVSGTMMFNRVKGINFVEMALYQALGFDINIVFNNIDISLGKALVAKYKCNMIFSRVYIDFDDTLWSKKYRINTNLIKFIIQCKNENMSIYLLTKSKNKNYLKILNQYGILKIFNKIIHIDDIDNKSHYMEHSSLLIDDSFKERMEAISNGYYAINLDALEMLIKD